MSRRNHEVSGDHSAPDRIQHPYSLGFNGTRLSHSARSHDALSPSWKIGEFYLFPPRWSRPITARNRSCGFVSSRLRSWVGSIRVSRLRNRFAPCVPRAGSAWRRSKPTIDASSSSAHIATTTRAGYSMAPSANFGASLGFTSPHSQPRTVWMSRAISPRFFLQPQRTLSVREAPQRRAARHTQPLQIDGGPVRSLLSSFTPAVPPVADSLPQHRCPNEPLKICR